MTATCRHADPLKNYGYVSAADRAEKMLTEGWTQWRCKECRLWIWKKPTKLEKLLAREKNLRHF